MIESHVARATGILFSLSEQELVSCAANPLHCGGTGGCGGSTAEIAMEYVRTHGMVDEWTFGYASNHGAKVNCTLEEEEEEESKSSLRGRRQDDDDDKHYLKHAVASIDGWMTLPRNNYTAVMNAVAQIGPLAISVACHPWVMYKEGIYSGTLRSGKETDVSAMAGIVLLQRNMSSLIQSCFFCRLITWLSWKAMEQTPKLERIIGSSVIRGDQNVRISKCRIAGVCLAFLSTANASLD